MSRLSIKKYKDMKVDGVANADPYQLIQIVFQNIIGKLTGAKAYLNRQDLEQKGILIGESITLLGALQDSLDMENGGEISQNLSALYDYMQNRLITANFENNVEVIDEVISLVTEIKTGWDGIPAEARQRPQPAVANQAAGS